MLKQVSHLYHQMQLDPLEDLFCRGGKKYYNYIKFSWSDKSILLALITGLNRHIPAVYYYRLPTSAGYAG